LATFRGTYDFTLDAKNRLTIPSKLRASLSDGVVLAAALEPCVGIWRPADHEAWTASMLADANPRSPGYRQLARFFSANSVAAELDGAGRVMVPPHLMKYAGLDREVALVGATDSLEIWDRATWRDYDAETSGNVADIAAGLGGAI
jgi:MraZ protein